MVFAQSEPIPLATNGFHVTRNQMEHISRAIGIRLFLLIPWKLLPTVCNTEAGEVHVKLDDRTIRTARRVFNI